MVAATTHEAAPRRKVSGFNLQIETDVRLKDTTPVAVMSSEPSWATLTADEQAVLRRAWQYQSVGIAIHRRDRDLWHAAESLAGDNFLMAHTSWETGHQALDCDLTLRGFALYATRDGGHLCPTCHGQRFVEGMADCPDCEGSGWRKPDGTPGKTRREQLALIGVGGAL